jgi:hypothetical protein
VAGRNSSTTQQSEVGKLVKVEVVVEGKLHRRGGKIHLPCEL